MHTLQHLLDIHFTDLKKIMLESGADRIFGMSMPHLAALLCSMKNCFVAVEDTPEKAEALFHDAEFFKNLFDSQNEIIYLPEPADIESIGRRARILLDISSGKKISIITSVNALGVSVDPGEQCLNLSKDMEISRDKLRELLISRGYTNRSLVVEKGEFSERGWVFDIFPSTEDLPVRLEFFGDTIDLIRTFDIETQRSIGEKESILIYPAAQQQGVEEILLYEYYTEAALIWASSEEPPQDKDALVVSHLPFAGAGIDADERPVSGLGILPEERKGIDELPNLLETLNRKIVIALPSEGQVERLHGLMTEKGVPAAYLEPKELVVYEGMISVVKAALSSGCSFGNIIFLSDLEIFGKRLPYRSAKKSKISRLLLTIDDLKPGDLVVHEDHGIGRFIGLERFRSDDSPEDMLTIEYANGDRVFLPFYNINKLQRYSSGDDRQAALDKLGSKAWIRTKQKAKKGIKELAQKLIKLYAERRTERGFTFSEDTSIHREFDDFFPYEETPDQQKAIEDIKKHMSMPDPMDMLLCGDVGYGKTEVAVKAAFRAVYDAKQVAVLVPTTLLAEQHWRTFSTRFSGFPVKIDYINRFRKKSEIKEALRALEAGETDIIIGTHMLLSKNVRFSDMGMLIIDEEHKFGVAQKEKVKEIKKGVDAISMTATPIPRTLHMSLSGIRQMSVIETPPEERLSVKTLITRFNNKVIQDAVRRELQRGGQIYFVHNRIKDIEKAASLINRLVPEARVGIGHGQMREHELENIMLRFFSGEVDVLVCTAIISSGIDIPNANTIIIDRADTFGLSDLYQLKGRVGRSDKQAFAYFLIPGEELMTEDSKKRLSALQEMSYLGAGFRLALKDLEIRGAGNLLGPEQSGHMHKIGFEMYMDMLEKAVAELKGEERSELPDTQIKLDLPAFIPEEYIPDITLRLSFYKRLSKVDTKESLNNLKEEMADRFGSLPEPVRNLMLVMNIKLLGQRLFIAKISGGSGSYRFTFPSAEKTDIKIPDDFFDRLLKTLFDMQTAKDKDYAIRFYKDGFEIVCASKNITGAVMAVEKALSTIIENALPDD
ncbi:MAG: transcription-repair coupling factor [Dissulfurispiraceae bacterium]|jgi:transcription-repair coupling factor (superfamily II helicase)|nr:transcription-repair coupling factor [Dissulfurispiraceae bacterium]